MSEIDVEPVDDVGEEAEEEAEPDDRPAGETGRDRFEGMEDFGSLGPASDAPEYVLYGGKGGVGKTTMAAATALASAAGGTRTLVVSTDPAHSLSDVYERPVPDRPDRIHDEYPLWGVEIDPDAAVEEAAMFGEEGGGPLGGLGDALGGDANPLGGGMPGADEAAAFQQLLRLLDDDRFDRVVVDTAPTGHTLRLLELPDIMDSMVGRFLSLRERMGGMMEGLSGMLGGDDAETDPEEELDDLRELSDRIERLRAVLRDPARTDFRVVMVPEEMSVAESERLLERLGEFGIPVGTVVVNRVMESLVDVIEAPEGEFVSPDLEHCEFCQRRWSVQQDALARAQEIFRGHEIRRVPLFADEVRGEDQLRIVARCLA